MATFAAMEEIKFDYIDDDVLMLTEFGELVKLETQELDRYLVLACNKGRLMVDVNGETIQMQGVDALILPPKTRLSNYMASPDLSCDFVGISSLLVKRLLGSHIEEWNRSIYVNRTNHIVADEEVRKQFAYYRDIIYFKMQQHERRFHHEVVMHSCKPYCLTIWKRCWLMCPSSRRRVSPTRNRLFSSGSSNCLPPATLSISWLIPTPRNSVCRPTT